MQELLSTSPKIYHVLMISNMLIIDLVLRCITRLIMCVTRSEMTGCLVKLIESERARILPDSWRCDNPLQNKTLIVLWLFLMKNYDVQDVVKYG